MHEREREMRRPRRSPTRPLCLATPCPAACTHLSSAPNPPTCTPHTPMTPERALTCHRISRSPFPYSQVLTTTTTLVLANPQLSNHHYCALPYPTTLNPPVPYRATAPVNSAGVWSPAPQKQPNNHSLHYSDSIHYRICQHVNP